MIKGSQLVGRAVVDMDAAERLGKIKEVIVQRDGERVAGFVVTRGESFLGSGGTRRTVPASALNAIGPDAVTVRGEGLGKESTSELESLPLMSDVIGHKMVTQSGRLIGAIDDILIDAKDGTIIGFAVGEGVKSKLESVFNSDRARSHGYVRADADLQVGNDLIVIPDDAFVEGDLMTRAREKESSAAAPVQSDGPSRSWAEERPSKADKSNIWKRRTKVDDAAAARTRSGDAAAGESARRFSSVPNEPHHERTGLEKEVDWTAPSGGAETSR